MNLTGKQILSIVAAVVSVLMLATSQLTDLFGPVVAKNIVSVAALVNMVLSSVVAAMTGQSSLVKDVQAMPGIQKIVTNASANDTLTQLAADPSNLKIEKGA